MNIGGPAVHVALLVKNLNKNRFSPSLITGTISPHEGDMSYLLQRTYATILRIPELQREINPFKDFVSFLKILKIIIKESPDIVHTHTAKAGTLSRLAVMVYNTAWQRNAKVVHTFHGNVLEGYFSGFKSKIFAIIERVAAGFTDAVIAISPTLKMELTDKFAVTTSPKIQTINLGLDLSKFIRVKQKGLFKKSRGLSEETPLIGIVGRLTPIKNITMFLDAARHLIDTHSFKDIKFAVIGDGELRGMLEQYARNSDLQDYVIFTGWQRDLASVYADLDLLSLTSLNEGTPFSIIEAMASGVPVIATDVGGVPDLMGQSFKINMVPHNENGFKVCERGIVCPKNDAVALANAMKYALESRLLSDVSKRILNARKFVVQNYSNAKQIKEIEFLYEKLAANI